MELLWSVFSRIWTKHGDFQSKSGKIRARKNPHTNTLYTVRKIVTFTKVLHGKIYSDGARSVGYKDMRRTCSQENTNEIQTKQEIIGLYDSMIST